MASNNRDAPDTMQYKSILASSVITYIPIQAHDHKTNRSAT